MHEYQKFLICVLGCVVRLVVRRTSPFSRGGVINVFSHASKIIIALQWTPWCVVGGHWYIHVIIILRWQSTFGSHDHYGRTHISARDVSQPIGSELVTSIRIPQLVGLNPVGSKIRLAWRYQPQIIHNHRIVISSIWFLARVRSGPSILPKLKHTETSYWNSSKAQRLSFSLKNTQKPDRNLMRNAYRI